jgi:hypothetical protein
MSISLPTSALAAAGIIAVTFETMTPALLASVAGTGKVWLAGLLET